MVRSAFRPVRNAAPLLYNGVRSQNNSCGVDALLKFLTAFIWRKSLLSRQAPALEIPSFLLGSYYI